MTGASGNLGSRISRCPIAVVLLLAGCAESYTAYYCDESGECRAADECVAGECGIPPDDTAPASEETDARPPDGDGAAECAAQVIPFTDTDVTVLIPAGARFMEIKAWGAGGNQELVCPYEDAGMGGFTKAVFELGTRAGLRPGDVLSVVVGQLGRSGLSGDEIDRHGFGTWGGGGLSGVFLGEGPVGENDRARALVVAGGGGSAGGTCSPGGPGNHPTAAGGESTMRGSAGADGPNGGGGGYAGGTGGGRGQGGRGGSGYVAPDALGTPVLAYAEPGAGIPPGIDDPDYDGTSAGVESDGLVVIRFTCEAPPLM